MTTNWEKGGGRRGGFFLSRFAFIVIIITLTVLLLDIIINLLIWQQCQLEIEMGILNDDRVIERLRIFCSNIYYCSYHKGS